MVSFSYKRHGLWIEQQWMCGENISTPGKKIDIVMAHGLGSSVGTEKQETLITDLTVPLEEIRKGFAKNTSYEIRRAEKEHVSFKCFKGDEISDELLHGLADTSFKMYASKGLEGEKNEGVLKAASSSGGLMITVAYHESEVIPLVYHAYLFDEKQTRLWQSCSLFRENKTEANLIGYANRGLHWYDINAFKEIVGSEFMDWGGISSSTNPNGIDRFKLSFGGMVKTYYNSTIGTSIKGKSYIWLRSKVCNH